MNVVSIQSSVAYGHVGNSAAVFPLQRLGFEVWPVNTVHFSNHTGYGEWRGPVLAAEDVREVLRGVEERGALSRCDAVLSGYMGDASLGEIIVETARKVKSRNEGALYCCDPVMGDVGRGFFVREGIPEFMREVAVPEADVITPNQFELEYLTGESVRTLEGALRAADAARELGPELVLITSLVREDADEGTIEMLAVSGEGAWLVGTPVLPVTVNGAGDATAALFLAHSLLAGSPEKALARTAASVFAVLERTSREGSREILLVASQEEIAHPPASFEAVRVR
ncbi:pyridoxal kinase [Rubrobacter radiotolerans]|uniref:Pyridoxal kinase PdxY n=1 Tax=Rubrobacter radiotolerans TaxID=42256 RepID=A0A023X5B6_RUBRA|nr:pyridoxal kinase PdxY [Rubrobacter radiotolerans]AHY47518.1 pyridoxal kinase [Rubrobacter radiotolerans]MDX5894921.1 pyridoxal kinase PdxY [Rubrobacter radiotolerans]SMC07071.1 Pyridoxal kinase [Rubrobacter radiotolerans DSM 5868]